MCYYETTLGIRLPGLLITPTLILNSNSLLFLFHGVIIGVIIYDSCLVCDSLHCGVFVVVHV